MSSREWEFRINDMMEAIQRIALYSEGLDQLTFEANQQAIDATVRNLEIIGEAASHIPAAISSQYPHIPWREIKDMRNILIHEYFGVHADIIWKTITHDLPSLKAQLADIKRNTPHRKV